MKIFNKKKKNQYIFKTISAQIQVRETKRLFNKTALGFYVALILIECLNQVVLIHVGYPIHNGDLQ